MKFLSGTGADIKRSAQVCKKKRSHWLDLDPLAVGGFIRLITFGIVETSWFYVFAALLAMTDLVILVLNTAFPARSTRQTVIPPAFTPSRPPPFFDHPFVYCLCKLALWLGDHAPHWMQEWSQWQGIMSDGRWPPVDRSLDLETVSRSPCPALNALANHGILNKSGRALSFHAIAANVSRTYNLSPTLAVQLLSAAWPLFKAKRLIDLEALAAHGLIEHDASLLRPDLHQSCIKSQTKPDQELISRYFSEPVRRSETSRVRVTRRDGKKIPTNGEVDTEEEGAELDPSGHKLTHVDFSRLLRQRRDESKTNNASYVDKFWFRFFGSGNCALLIHVFDGDLYDIRTFIGAGVPINKNHPPHHHHQHVPDQSDVDANRVESHIDLIDFEVLPYDRWRPSNVQHPWGSTIFESIYSTFKIESRT